MPEHKIDEVGRWTEIKLRIIEDYAAAYAIILNKRRLKFAYIDGFAGLGEHKSKETGQLIEGSPARALRTIPRFHEYHFIDLDEKRTAHLTELASKHKKVFVHNGDCNQILINEVFPNYKYETFSRALCLLDPYDLNPNWAVVKKAGEMKTIDIFINFMIMDANMNVLWKNPDRVSGGQLQRMNDFWGDDSWRHNCYKKKEMTLFDLEEKASNDEIAEAYRKRLVDVAGFEFVPQPIPMRNSIGKTIYYLFFASPKEAGAKIARHIFKKYRDAEGPHG